MQATAAAAPFLLTTAARRLLALHLLPVLAAWTLLAWACTALASACCVCRIERRRCPSLVVLYAHCVVSAGEGEDTAALHALPQAAFQSTMRVCLPRRSYHPSIHTSTAVWQGGYHSDLQQAWRGLEQAVAVAAPEVK